MKARAYFDIFPPEAAAAVREVRAEDRYASRFQIIERVLHRWRGAASPAEVERYAAAYNDICEGHQRTCAERPGASAVLERLAGKRTLMLCSGTWEEPLRRVVAARGWDRHFRAVLGGPRRKAENLREAISGFAPAEVLVVGDTRDDLDAARAAGCRFAGVRSPSTDFDPAAVAMIAELRELEAMC